MNALDPQESQSGLDAWFNSIRPYTDQDLNAMMVSDPDKAAEILAARGIAPPPPSASGLLGFSVGMPKGPTPQSTYAEDRAKIQAPAERKNVITGQPLPPPVQEPPPVVPPQASTSGYPPAGSLDPQSGAFIGPPAQPAASASPWDPTPVAGPDMSASGASSIAQNSQPQQASAVAPPAVGAKPQEPDLAKVLSGLKAMAPPAISPVSSPAAPHADPRGMASLDPVKLMQMLTALGGPGAATPGLGASLHGGRVG